MPQSEPSDLKFEIWRLVRHRGLTYGDVVLSRRGEARTQRIGRFLAPTSKSAKPTETRIALAKKFVRHVDSFLKTPIGSTYPDSLWWAEWLETGIMPGRITFEPLPDAEPLTRDNYERALHDNLINYAEWRAQRKRR